VLLPLSKGTAVLRLRMVRTRGAAERHCIVRQGMREGRMLRRQRSFLGAAAAKQVAVVAGAQHVVCVSGGHFHRTPTSPS